MADSGAMVAPSGLEQSEKSIFFRFKPQEIANQVRNRVYGRETHILSDYFSLPLVNLD